MEGSIADDAAVEETDPDQLGVFRKAPRELVVLLARSGITRRVIVSQNDRGRAGDDRRLEDLSRMYDQRVEQANGNEVDGKDDVVGIDQDCEELLAVDVTNYYASSGFKPRTSSIGRVKAIPTPGFPSDPHTSSMMSKATFTFAGSWMTENIVLLEVVVPAIDWNPAKMGTRVERMCPMPRVSITVEPVMPTSR